MNHPLSLALIIYSAQILLVVAVAAMGERLLRAAAPTARLGYWRAAALLCLALPLLAPGAREPQAISVVFGSSGAAFGSAEIARPGVANTGVVLVWIWACGVAARVLWLLVGGWTLGQLRRRSVPAVLEADLDQLRSDLGSRADIRVSSEVRQPVTFGLRRPVILLPPAFGDLETGAQRAVVSHELLHVTRRDWAWIVLEQIVLTPLWFHPAAWWVIERLQLTREQVVDRLVVQRTGSKQAYMAALMAFADRARAGALAMAFIRRRHLASRFRQLSQEPNMPLTRLAFTAAVLATLVCSAALAAARELPLDLGALALQARSGARLEIRLAETSPGPGLTEATVPGSATPIYLHPTALATDADVTAARVIDLAGAQSGVGVSVSFSGQASARMMNGTATHIGRPMAIVLDGRVVSSPMVRAPIGRSAVITGVTADDARVLASRLSPEPQGTARQGKTVTLPSPIHEEKAYYSPAAMQAGIEGAVLLEAVVQKDGRSGTVTVIESLDTMYGLDEEAVKALKLWTWNPGTVDGKPVDVAVQVEMTFTLK